MWQFKRLGYVGGLFISMMVITACGGGGGNNAPSLSTGSSSSVSSSVSMSSSSSSSATSSSSTSSVSSSSSSSSSSVVALKSLVTTLGFPIGVAVGGPGDSDNLFTNTMMQTVVNTHFNSLVAGNIMKMSYLEPTQGNFTFNDADALYNYAHANGMVLHGHTLIWHADYQVPGYIKSFSGTPTEFNTALMNHVTQVATYFAGKVVSWDVVNEAIDDNNPAGWRQSVFYVKSGNSNVFI